MVDHENWVALLNLSAVEIDEM
jgi:naphthalene 1,2-dioxygenase system ferredoxin subunit